MTNGFRTRLIIVGALLIILLAVLLPRGDEKGVKQLAAAGGSVATEANGERRKATGTNRLGRTSAPATPEEVVAYKVKQFARDRRAIMLAMARRKNIQVPGAAERF